MPLAIQPAKITAWARAHSATLRKSLISIVLGISFSSIQKLMYGPLLEVVFAGSRLEFAREIASLAIAVYPLVLIVTSYFLFVRFERVEYALLFSFSAYLVKIYVSMCDLHNYPYVAGRCINPEPVLFEFSDIVYFIGHVRGGRALAFLIIFVVIGVSGVVIHRLKRLVTRWRAGLRS